MLCIAMLTHRPRRSILETRPKLENNIVFDIDVTVEETVGYWRFNDGRAGNWADSYSLASPVGQTWVRPYTISAENRSCVGFYSTWDIRQDDPYFRPSKAYFGYFCAAPGKEVSKEDVASFVANIDVRGVSMPLRVTDAYALTLPADHTPSQATQNKLQVAVQDGAGGGLSGLKDFPQLRGRYFRTLECLDSNC